MEKKEAVEQAKPQLNEARHLDTLINEKNRQIAGAGQEFETAAKKKNQHERLLQEKREQVKKVSDEERTLSAWKNQYAARQNAVGDINFIVSKVNEAARLVLTKKQAGIDVVTVENQLKESFKQKEQLEEQSKGKKSTLQDKQAAWDTENSKLVSVKIEILEQDKADIDLVLQDVVAASAHWKVLYHTLSDEASIKEKLAANEAGLESKSGALQKTEALVKEGKAKKDISENLLNKARLRVAEKVEELRSSLVAEEPCPVCGSREHPYTGQDPVLASVLQGLEKDHLVNAEAYDSLVRQFSGLQETCRNLTQSIDQQRKEMATKADSVKTQTAIWQAFKVQGECETVADPEKVGWLEQKIKLTKAGQEELQKKIRAYYTTKQQLDQQKIEVGKLEKELGKIAETLRDIERKKLSLAENFDRLQKEIENCQASLNVIERELLPYTENVGWDNNWKTNTPAFLEEANSFVKTWKGNLQKLETVSQQLNGLAITVQGLEQQSGGIAGDVSQKEAALSGLKDNLAALQERRRSIFNGEDAKKVEVSMGQEMLAAEKGLQAAKSAQQELSTKIARAETKKGQLQADLEKLQNNIQASSSQIANWLSLYNAAHNEPMDETRVLHLLSFSYAWVQGEQNALKAIDDYALKTLSVLKERENLVNLHLAKKPSETTLAELTDLQARAVSKLEETKTDKNEAVFKLQQDEDNKKKIGGLATAIEEKALSAENWGKLNDLIGSADGKKFRQIAQEYTLDVLLTYANMHLGMLSKRYSVQRIPSSLGLQVIDRDMGDEVRTIFSLSGGECFLVSLSLALGLSSLSSSRMNVESLFIDEGFGSLDPLTLAVAMDALERLHNQGRKVGVISHVTEMTERIPTQIRVSRVSNGKSKIDILANLN